VIEGADDQVSASCPEGGLNREQGGGHSSGNASSVRFVPAPTVSSSGGGGDASSVVGASGGSSPAGTSGCGVVMDGFRSIKNYGVVTLDALTAVPFGHDNQLDDFIAHPLGVPTARPSRQRHTPGAKSIAP